MSSGGARPGAGRKPSSSAKVQMSVYVKVSTREALRERKIAPGVILDQYIDINSKGIER